MNKTEYAVAEETTVETTGHQDFELSLSELDMVAGGSYGSILA